ncbi:nitroreductase [Xinfangfangia sp. D13-10-4-6]|uniref:nitroreductase family protein n=1 Tax=Pseudogemmobacter hezensis TaxID=2737662 RepID=UPI0015532AD1|nr:nitroreductase [Pseudogemmobacter hezensis]NPD15484.1 nitroreductase [Pseudogemmobacter hezensis]
MPAKNPEAPEALEFLATRLSQPAKMFTAPVPSHEELAAILQIALRVPDHGKLEPWRLIVLEKPDFIRLADLAEARAKELGADAEKTEKARGQFDRGLMAVAVISSPKISDKIPQAEQVLSAGALCMNLVTVATAAGWGANWLSGWPSHDAVFRARAFGCSAEESVAGIVHIATPARAFTDRPRPDPARVVQWGLGG